ncbi:MAG: hypothetical protein GQ531_09795 [Sulfurovum sp.]|nr:hypothetical protein [Sulfurovum sp.]
MSCRIFRVGVFFDGTGNSKKPDSSKGKMSNIAKLSELYIDSDKEFKDKFGKQTIAKMLYTNGVGTYDNDIKNFFNPIDRKFDKGGGGGGAKRIDQMINELILELDAHPYAKDDTEKFTKREIDVFGFSRGAAMARDFVNTFYEEVINVALKYNDVRFNFIGIYDTVGSFGKAGTAINMKPKYPNLVSESDIPDGFKRDEWYGMKDSGSGDRKDKTRNFPLDGAQGDDEKDAMLIKYNNAGWDTYAVYFGMARGKKIYQIRGRMKEKDLFEPYNFDFISKSATKIVHMIAHDEVRKNFPLTNIKGAGTEYSFMGVHSDIGGGYGEEKTELHSMYLKEYIGYIPSLKKDARLYGERKLAELRAKGMNLASSWYVDVHEGTQQRGYGICTVYLKANRVVSNDLATITLDLMYREAIRNNVPFKGLDEVIPTSLQKYYTHAVTNKMKAYAYEKENDGKNIKLNYVHHSAVDPANLFSKYKGNTSLGDKLFNDSADGGGNDARYIDIDGEQVDGRKNPKLAIKVERAIYNNGSTNARSPKKLNA